MLTADKLDAMTPEDRTALWSRTCIALHGNSSYRAEIARQLGVTRVTLFRWERENAVPYMALMLVDLWCSRKQLGDLKSASDQIAKWSAWLD